ncbi:MAG: hypothetical protein JKY19_10015 [Alcanivoracaceae bacterium]|nr:hypothetical protein [Alcanivoracaceae bacterium]
MKNISVLIVFLLAVACSSDEPLNTPIQFQNPSGFFHALAALEHELSNENYLALTDAIGYLKALDTSQISLDDFYSGFAGLTPSQIIHKAYDLKQSKDK